MLEYEQSIVFLRDSRLGEQREKMRNDKASSRLSAFGVSISYRLSSLSASNKIPSLSVAATTIVRAQAQEGGVQ